MKMKSPVACMCEAMEQYNLFKDVASHIRAGDFGDISYWKRIVKSVIWKHEDIKWRSTCYLYAELDIYLQSVPSITLHPWLYLGKLYPRMSKLISNVMSVLMACQPVNLQRNFNNKICKMCHERARDTPEHILLNCLSLESKRATLLQNIIDEMPYAMKRDFSRFDSYRKVQFLLSGFNCKFNIEWLNMYRGVLVWVQELYSQRSQLYDNIDEITL